MQKMLLKKHCRSINANEMNKNSNDMKEQLTIISDDLNHGIITEKEARTKLLFLFGVIESFPKNIQEISILKDKIYSETIEEMDADTADDAYEMGIDYAIHEICLNR
jgi:hypothetical protein